MSASTSEPSVKRTPSRVSEAMFGLAVIVPCAIRERMSSETVGWASPKRWSGLGSP
jgi:hypothetical protein